MDAAHTRDEQGPDRLRGLSDRDRRVLGFEHRWWLQPAAKEQRIREVFDMSPTSYYQVLNALIDRPEALAHSPVVVNRLRRLRSQRRSARSVRRPGPDTPRQGRTV